jgi:cyclic pyranopterin phosphate synthase
MLSELKGLEELCLTTNGSSLEEKAEALARAGLRRVNVSLDTLDPEKFKRITQRGDLGRVLDGLFAARAAGISPIKINAVIERGVNDDEIIDLVRFAKTHRFGLRFIEYMDVGNANNWKSERMVSKSEILTILKSHFEVLGSRRHQASAPSIEYRLAGDESDIGVIASVTEPFCSTCNRARLTADGKFVTCLFSNRGSDLKGLLRAGASDQELLRAIVTVWTNRTDRYSEERLEALNSASGYHPEQHKKMEMIRLGG